MLLNKVSVVVEKNIEVSTILADFRTFCMADENMKTLSTLFVCKIHDLVRKK